MCLLHHPFRRHIRQSLDMQSRFDWIGTLVFEQDFSMHSSEICRCSGKGVIEVFFFSEVLAWLSIFVSVSSPMHFHTFPTNLPSQAYPLAQLYFRESPQYSDSWLLPQSDFISTLSHFLIISYFWSSHFLRSIQAFTFLFPTFFGSCFLKIQVKRGEPCRPCWVAAGPCAVVATGRSVWPGTRPCKAKRRSRRKVVEIFVFFWKSERGTKPCHGIQLSIANVKLSKSRFRCSPSKSKREFGAERHPRLRHLA